MRTLCLLLLAQALFAKVEGTVTNSISQEPLKKVIVTLRPLRGSKTIVVETNSGGRFTIDQVPPGSYLISAERSSFKQETVDRQLVIESGHDLNIVIKMNPLSAITGRILDYEGDPVRGAPVTAMRYSYDNGNRRLEPASEVVTDDRGVFRLFGLDPGRYYVRTSNFRLHSSSSVPYVSTFFPSATDPIQASSVALGIGSEARGIDITLRREALHKVSGTLPPTETAGGYDLRLISKSNEGAATSFPTSLSNLYGVVKFVFDKVATGSYELIGTRSIGGQTLYGRQMVDVGGADVEGLSLSLTPGFDATGKITYDGTPSLRLVNIAVKLIPVDSYPNQARSSMVTSDGTFLIKDLPPTAFDISINGAREVYLKSDSRVDFTRGPAPLALTFASDFGEIMGVVKDENGYAAQGVRVTAVPSGGRKDLFRSNLTDEAGRFRLIRVAPGDYTMFAWDHVPEGAPQNASFRKPYEKYGRQIHLNSKGSEAVDLPVIQVVER